MIRCVFKCEAVGIYHWKVLDMRETLYRWSMSISKDLWPPHVLESIFWEHIRGEKLLFAAWSNYVPITWYLPIGLSVSVYCWNVVTVRTLVPLVLKIYSFVLTCSKCFWRLYVHNILTRQICNGYWRFGIVFDNKDKTLTITMITLTFTYDFLNEYKSEVIDSSK